MSGRYLYCVVPDSLPAPAGSSGIDGEAVLDLAAPGVRVWYSALRERPSATLERVRAHNHVVAIPLAHAVTPIPLRFGQWLGTHADLVARAREHAASWQARLAELAGACELGVRARWRGPQTARDVQQPPLSGRAYLEQIASQHAGSAALRAEADRLAAELRTAVGGLALREHVEQGVGVLAVAHLVRTEHVSAYRAAVERLRVRPDVEIAVTGPWPPYSFAG